MEISLMMPLFQRQHSVLNLAFRHAIILLHRHSLLTNFANLTSTPLSNRKESLTPIDQSVADCIEAARDILALVDDLFESQQLYRSFWVWLDFCRPLLTTLAYNAQFTHFTATCAIVVLYIHTIQRRLDPVDAWYPSFAAAEKCQFQLSSSVEETSFARRSSIVLEELRQEVIKQTSHVITQQPHQTETMSLTAEEYALPPAFATIPFPPSSVNPDASMRAPPSSDLLPTATLNAPQPPMSDVWSITAPSFMADMMGWGEFDSLVSKQKNHYYVHIVANGSDI